MCLFALSGRGLSVRSRLSGSAAPAVFRIIADRTTAATAMTVAVRNAALIPATSPEPAETTAKMDTSSAVPAAPATCCSGAHDRRAVRVQVRRQRVQAGGERRREQQRQAEAQPHVQGDDPPHRSAGVEQRELPQRQHHEGRTSHGERQAGPLCRTAGRSTGPSRPMARPPGSRARPVSRDFRPRISCRYSGSRITAAEQGHHGHHHQQHGHREHAEVEGAQVQQRSLGLLQLELAEHERNAVPLRR